MYVYEEYNSSKTRIEFLVLIKVHKQISNDEL